MVKDAGGREGLSAGAIAKELGATPAAVKKALAELKLEAGLREGRLRLLLRRADRRRQAGPQVAPSPARVPLTRS